MAELGPPSSITEANTPENVSLADAEERDLTRHQVKEWEWEEKRRAWEEKRRAEEQTWEEKKDADERRMKIKRDAAEKEWEEKKEADEQRFKKKMAAAEKEWEEKQEAMEQKMKKRLAANEKEWEEKQEAMEQKVKKKLAAAEQEWEERKEADENKWKKKLVNAEKKWKEKQEAAEKMLALTLDRNILAEQLTNSHNVWKCQAAETERVVHNLTKMLKDLENIKKELLETSSHLNPAQDSRAKADGRRSEAEHTGAPSDEPVGECEDTFLKTPSSEVSSEHAPAECTEMHRQPNFSMFDRVRRLHAEPERSPAQGNSSLRSIGRSTAIFRHAIRPPPQEVVRFAIPQIPYADECLRSAAEALLHIMSKTLRQRFELQPKMGEIITAQDRAILPIIKTRVILLELKNAQKKAGMNENLPVICLVVIRVTERTRPNNTDWQAFPQANGTIFLPVYMNLARQVVNTGNATNVCQAVASKFLQ